MAHKTATSTLFGGVIAKEIAANLGPQFGAGGAATLVKPTPRERATDNQLGGTRASSTSYRAQGFVSDYEAGQVDGTLIQSNDREIVLLGATIRGHGLTNVVPEAGDRVTIGGATYQIVRVEADPALATYECQGRR